MEVPELFQDTTSYYRNPQFTPERRPTATDLKSGVDHFIIEDLLDFSNEDDNLPVGDATFDTLTGNSTDSSTVTTLVDSCNSSVSQFEPQINSRTFPDANFSSGGELCVPYEELAELEWLSNLVEESFSSEDMQKLQLISGVKARPEQVSESDEFQPQSNQNTTNHHPIFTPDMSVPGKARSKRSRAAAACNWSSRLLALSPSPSPTTSSSESDIVSNPNPGKKSIKAPMMKKKEGYEGGATGDGRKCLHCATDKTPQWRTGPLGPKTLCNACGVRYKSGRLVPEYRPAASPTFVLTQHSNSHRKVLELRRQKEMQRSHVNHHHHHHHQQYMHSNNMYNVSNGDDDYLIHHHSGPDFRQLI